MRWINQAFKLGPKTWVRLIIIKKQYNIQNIFSRNERKPSKNYSKVMYGHSKWSLHNFELDFGSIQINFLTKGLQKHFFSSPLKYAIFEKYGGFFSWQILIRSDPNVVEHIMTWDQGYIWSSKRHRTKYMWRHYYLDYIAFYYTWNTFLKSTRPFVRFVSDRTLSARMFFFLNYEKA